MNTKYSSGYIWYNDRQKFLGKTLSRAFTKRFLKSRRNEPYAPKIIKLIKVKKIWKKLRWSSI